MFMHLVNLNLLKNNSGKNSFLSPGIVLYELLTGTLPYSDVSNKDQVFINNVLYFYNNAMLHSIDSVHGGLWFPEASIGQNEDGHSEGAEKITGQLFEPQERREAGLQKCEDPPV